MLYNAVTQIIQQENGFLNLQNSLAGREILKNNMHKPFISVLPDIERAFVVNNTYNIYNLDDSFHLENIQIRVEKFIDSQANGKVTLIEEDLIEDKVERAALISIITSILQNGSKMDQ